MNSHGKKPITGTTEDEPNARAPGAVSRRRVLQGAVGVAALAGSGAAMAGAGEADASPRPELHPGAGQEPIMAHLRDLSAGTIDVFVGTRRVTIHDRDLAVRLANAAR